MTLCIAAACEIGQNERGVIVCTDSREETNSAGGDVAHKHDDVAVGWHCLLADDISKAKDFAATCRSVLDPSKFTAQNIFDKINEASSRHKAKLCERMVEMRLGISFKRFLENGNQELTAEVRSRVLYEMEELNFGCDLILFGFIQDFPYILSTDHNGEVSLNDNFVAIGSGSEVAEAVLYQRKQHCYTSVGSTLYNLFEAGTLAHKSNAPGVGPVSSLSFFRPMAGRSMQFHSLKPVVIKILNRYFGKYGPKKISELDKLGMNSFDPVP